MDLYLVEGEEEEEDLLVTALSGLSILGFESVGDAVTPSSEPALLLRLADPLFAPSPPSPLPLPLDAGIVLHTLSSLRERPMKRDTLPVPLRAASINVPSRVCKCVCVTGQNAAHLYTQFFFQMNSIFRLRIFCGVVIKA